ncbi:hypothetical protein [Gryllotalpicola sp.]|uniref:hypothetical protein n=1 Tax=Gryllotalpicola sp. TaxID=1932787 RepID=UPI00260CD9B9|nr:hypothetical protein [Gryllotalpicola sp.]
MTSAFELLPVERAAADLERVRELNARVRSLQRITLAGSAVEGSPVLPTLPDLQTLLPGGGLQPGGVYSVIGSTSLLMGLLAGPSAAGLWCAVVGVPWFGAEAASRLGIDLSRLVLVPSPGSAWLAVVAALADALRVVAVRPASRVSETDAARLRARLRQHDAALIAFGEWPGATARLSVAHSAWQGMGQGHGYPRERVVTVRAEVRGVARQGEWAVA